MGFSDAVQVLSVAMSAAAVMLATWTALRQSNVAQRANNLAFTMDLLKEHRSQTAAESRGYIFERLREECQPTAGFRNLPQAPRDHVYHVSALIDQIAFCVAHDLVDETLVSGLVGDSIADTWKVLAPFVQKERELRAAAGQNPEYREYFEDLAVRLSERPPSAARRRLRELRKLQKH